MKRRTHTQRERESKNSNRNDERKREWSGSYLECVCVLEIRYVYFMMLVASPWMLFFDYTRNSVAKNMRHIYLHVKFNVRSDILPMCTTQIQSCWYSSHLHTDTHREWESARTGESYGHSHTVCMFLHCTVLFVPWLPQAGTNRTQMYKNLSTLSQTNQSKMCSRSC